MADEQKTASFGWSCAAAVPSWIRSITVGLKIGSATASPCRIQVGFNGGAVGGFATQHESTDLGTAIDFRNLAGTRVGMISTTSTATAYNTTSDGRLKKNIKPLNDGLAKIMQLAPKKFQWKATGQKSAGLIAQEVAEIIDAMVTHDELTDTWGIDYSKAVPYLVDAIQELNRQIQALIVQVEELENPT